MKKENKDEEGRQGNEEKIDRERKRQTGRNENVGRKVRKGW